MWPSDLSITLAGLDPRHGTLYWLFALVGFLAGTFQRPLVLLLRRVPARVWLFVVAVTMTAALVMAGCVRITVVVTPAAAATDCVEPTPR